MGEFSAWHLLILAGVFVLLFGAKRLPDGARSLGRSLRIFKTEVKGLNDDEAAQAQAQLPPATTAAAPPAVTPPAASTAAPTTAPPVAAPPTTSEADAAQQHEAH